MCVRISELLEGLFFVCHFVFWVAFKISEILKIIFIWFPTVHEGCLLESPVWLWKSSLILELKAP